MPCKKARAGNVDCGQVQLIAIRREWSEGLSVRPCRGPFGRARIVGIAADGLQTTSCFDAMRARRDVRLPLAGRQTPAPNPACVAHGGAVSFFRASSSRGSQTPTYQSPVGYTRMFAANLKKRRGRTVNRRHGRRARCREAEENRG